MTAPYAVQAVAALNTLSIKDFQEAKALKKPPPGVDDITAVIVILLEGNPKDTKWGAMLKQFANPTKLMERLQGFTSAGLPTRSATESECCLPE